MLWNSFFLRYEEAVTVETVTVEALLVDAFDCSPRRLIQLVAGFVRRSFSSSGPPYIVFASLVDGHATCSKRRLKLPGQLVTGAPQIIRISTPVATALGRETPIAKEN